MITLQNFLSPWSHWVEALNWDIWTDQLYLKPEVVEWLDENAGPDHWDYHDIYGLVAFDSLSAATYFKLRFE